ncbi:hypothetical protein [Demequina sp.]|uniref:hypothetical protein n=1 Tax=Demequina sp. TaxID=2050685 RepID=UPI003D1489AC
MATDPRVTAAIDAVTAHLAADAAVTRAANAEPSDDAYIAVREDAQRHYAPGSGLSPLSGRFAVPGQVRAASALLPAGDVAPAKVFALASVADSVIALVGSLRDPQGGIVAEALLLEPHGQTWLVAGRAARDHLAPGLSFTSTGGAPVPLDLATAATLIAEPASANEAALVKEFINDHQ